MITMMEHPKHGRHPATGQEIAQLKAQGWVERAPKAKDPQEAPVLAEQIPVEPRQKRAYNRKTT